MALAGLFYNAIAKRTSTFALSIVVGALVFERAYDSITNAVFESHNRGKLWKDIKHQYEDKD